MKPAMHPDAVEFRRLMEEEMANWRVDSTGPAHFVVHDRPRYWENLPPVPGVVRKDFAINHFDFNLMDEASAFVITLAISKVLHRLDKRRRSKISKMKKELSNG